MKALHMITCAMLVASGSAVAADAQVGGTAQQNTSVTSDQGGANATHSNAASAAAEANQAQAQLAHGTEVNATLSKPVDSRSSKPGDPVTATTTKDTKSNGQVVIPRGSKLIGHVTSARSRGNSAGQPSDSGATSGAASGVVSSAGNASGAGNDATANAAGSAHAALGIVFDHAVLKDGRQIPMDATVQAIAASNSSASGSLRGSGAGLGGTGGAAGSGSAAGGGLLGSTVGGVTGAVGGAANATVGGATKAIARSPGAVGGLTSSGRLASGSHGVFGLDGYSLTSATSGSTEGSVITSTGRNVRLDGGTQMLLVSGTRAAEESASETPRTEQPKDTQ